MKQEAAAPAATLSTLLGLARTAQTAGNSQEALEYFNRVLEADPKNSEAWLGKGVAAGWQSTLANIRISETLVAFGHAIGTAPEAEKAATIKRAVDDANHLIVTIYNLARSNLLEYVSLKNTWSEYIVTISRLIDALDEVSCWLPGDAATLENIVHLCKDNIEGVSYRDQFDQNLPKAWTLTPQYEATLRSKLDAAAEKLRALNPSYAAPLLQKKEPDACFVVTATMGDFDHPKVVFLRQFRDEWILRQPWGRSFVELYYSIGPKIAAFISRSHTRRRISYYAVVLPAAWSAERLLRRPLGRFNP